MTGTHDIIHQELNVLRDRNCSFLAKRIFNLYPNNFPDYQCEAIKLRLLEGVVLRDFLDELKALLSQKKLEKHSLGSVTLISSSGFYQDQISEIDVEVLNISDDVWETTKLTPIFLSYHWYDLDGNEVVFEGERTALVEKVLPNHSMRQKMAVLAPNYVGELRLSLTLVNEGEYWLDELGLSSYSINFNVLPVEPASLGSVEIHSKFEGGYAGTSQYIDVQVINDSEESWVSSPETPIYLCYHIYHVDGSVYQHEGLRSDIKSLPGSKNTQDVKFKFPVVPGLFLLEMTVVHDGVAWLENQGLRTTRHKFQVLENEGYNLTHHANKIYFELVDTL